MSGLFVLALMAIAINGNLRQSDLAARIFPFSQSNSSEQIFLPSDFVAMPGESGELVVRAGNGFPPYARYEVMGLSFQVQWNDDYVDFLGVTTDNTVFEGGDYELSYTHQPGTSYAEIVIYTSGTEGVRVDPGANLALVMIELKDNAVVGDELIFELENGQVAYDEDDLKSVSLRSMQDGVVRVGSSSEPEAIGFTDFDYGIAESMLAKPGEERLVAIKSERHNNLAGFMIDLQFPDVSLDYLGYETEGTILERQGFQVVTNTETENHLMLLGATGQTDGVEIMPDEPLIYLRFFVSEDVELGRELPLVIERMETVDSDANSVQVANTADGSIAVNSFSSLRLIDAIPLSSTSIRLNFTDDIVTAELNDIAFSPSLKNSSSQLEIVGKSIILRNLSSMLPDRLYEVRLQENIFGNVAGTLSSEHNYGFFSGFPAQYPVNRFRVESVEATSENTVLVTFTEPINEQSIEKTDFMIDGLTVFDVVQQGANSILITTGSQTSMAGSTWLTINNSSSIHDLTSQSQELLSLNVVALTPFNAPNDGPMITDIEAEKDDLVHITFDKPLLGSSITSSAFTVAEDGRTTNLVTGTTFFDLSADHRTVTLQGVPTVAGRIYRLNVTPGVLRENGPDNYPLSTYGNLGSFAGQGSFFTPWDFVMQSAEATAPDRVQITFSEEVEEADYSPLDFEIWTRDSGESPRQLTVVSVQKQENSVILETELQQENVSYFVLADPTKMKSVFGEVIGIPAGRGFLGFASGQMRAATVSPAVVDAGSETEITITGVHIPEDAIVRLKLKTLETTIESETKATAIIPADIAEDNYDLILVAPNGVESRIPNAILVVDPEREERLKPQVLSEESYASPFKVTNDGNYPTTLWVRIQDPRGVSDIDKVVADLRAIDGPAARDMELHEFVDDKAWYKLEVTVPSSVPTSTEVTEIPITVENKTGRKGFGTVTLQVTRDLFSGIDPVITDTGATPALVAPGSETEIEFHAEVTDEDGGGNVARVVLDASQIDLGIIVLNAIPELEEDRQCERSDYVVGEWSACINLVQTRTVELNPGLDCIETSGVKPIDQRACVGGICTRNDWEPAQWGFCVDGKQTREYQKKADSTCVGTDDKPNPEIRDCETNTTSLFNPLNWLIPKAHAKTVFGNVIWYKSEKYKIPATAPEGTYELPLTVIDREGGEARTTITVQINRDAGNAPHIDEDEIFISPKSTIINDGKSEFQIFARATDPNGHTDIVSVVANLSPIGLPPMAMDKGQVEGAGAWYSTKPMTIPRSVIPGFRNITVSATDKEGSVTQADARFYVATPESSGDGPEIPSDKAYSNPRAFLNDQETTGTMYILVEEGDAEITHVSLNLGTILRYVGSGNESEVAPAVPPSQSTDEDPENLPPAPNPAAFAPLELIRDLLPKAIAQTPDQIGNGFPDSGNNNSGSTETIQNTPDAEPTCVSTEAIVCMEPMTNEGGRSKWFYVSGLTVRENVPASQNPYFIKAVATDADGRKTEAEIPVYITDGVLPFAMQDLPYLVAVTATSKNQVEAYFSSSLDPSRIRKDAFTFVLFDDLGTELPIRDMDIRSDGRVITFTTNFMNPGDRYTLIADADQLGLRHVQPTDNQVDFKVPTEQDDAMFFKIESAIPLSPNSVEVVFTKDLQFSTLKTDGSQFVITKKGSDQQLAVKGAQLIKNGRTVLLSTAVQTIGTTYILRVDDVNDYTGKKLRLGTNIKTFPAYRNYEPNPFVITKTTNKEIIQMGETVTFNVKINNHSQNETYTDIQILDDFPEDMLEPMSVNTSAGFSCENDRSEIKCTIDSLAPETQFDFDAKFKAVGSGFATNTVSATESTGKSIASSANVSIVDAGNPFIIRKDPAKAEAVVEKPIRYEMSVTNRTKGQYITNVNLIDDYPESNLRLDNVYPSGSLTCQYDETEIRCLVPSFAPGATYRFAAEFTPIATGMAINTITATGTISEGMGEQSSGQQTTGAASAILEIWEESTNADFNGDGRVDFLDFSIFATVYQQPSSRLPQADFDNSGFIDFVDFSIFAQQYNTVVSRDTGQPNVAGGEDDDEDDDEDDESNGNSGTGNGGRTVTPPPPTNEPPDDEPDPNNTPTPPPPIGHKMDAEDRLLMTA
jgi:uncharacterized repeat protein (TIGR01451 family)